MFVDCFLVVRCFLGIFWKKNHILYLEHPIYNFWENLLFTFITQYYEMNDTFSLQAILHYFNQCVHPQCALGFNLLKTCHCFGVYPRGYREWVIPWKVIPCIQQNSILTILNHNCNTLLYLKEYYEIVGKSRPLSGFFLQKCISNHETKQSSKFQSDPSPHCFTINV